jgi:hypothetical protein
MGTIFGPKKDELCKQFTILHNEEILYSYRLANIVTIVKYKKLRWNGFVASSKKR